MEFDHQKQKDEMKLKLMRYKFDHETVFNLFMISKKTTLLFENLFKDFYFFVIF